MTRGEMVVESASGVAGSVFGHFFSDDKEAASERIKEIQNVDKGFEKESLKLEDIFAWLPPHATFLTSATFLLTRLTVSA